MNLNEESKAGYKKIIVAVFALAVILLFRSFVITRVVVSGNSMLPNFENSDVCLVEKFDITPERYDVVIVKEKGNEIIKRVIGLPGEIIKIEDGEVTVNDEKISDEFNFDTKEAGLISGEYTIPDGEYFVLGDNREVSYDSRYFGSVELEAIQGIVVCKLYPVTDFEIY